MLPGGPVEAMFLGDLKQVQSSFRLAREAQRNVELMWLTGHQDQITKSIARYLDQLDMNDRRAASETQSLNRESLTKKIAMRRAQPGRMSASLISEMKIWRRSTVASSAFKPRWACRTIC